MESLKVDQVNHADDKSKKSERNSIESHVRPTTKANTSKIPVLTHVLVWLKWTDVEWKADLMWKAPKIPTTNYIHIYIYI